MNVRPFLKNIIPQAFLLLLFLLPTASLFSWITLELTHTLERNGNWSSTKTGLEKGVIGGVSYFSTPFALHGGRLNLGALLGFQEVLSRKSFNPQRIVFDVKLTDQAYLHLIYNKTAQGYSTLRFSQNPLFESAHLVVDANDRFLKKETFSLQAWKKDWNQIRVDFEDDKVSLFVNNEPVGIFSDRLIPGQKVGFRGGEKYAFVDHVVIEDKERSPSFSDSFESGPFWPVFAEMFLILLFFNLLLILIIQLKPRKKWQGKPLHYLLTVNFLILLVSLSVDLTLPWCFTQFNFLSKLYVRSSLFLRGQPSSIETEKEVVERVRREYPQNQVSHRPRIIFMGTSQTWGAGAQRAGETFIQQLEKRLNADRHDPSPYELINTGISGSGSLTLFNYYEKEWILLKPDLVVVDLSNNDTHPKEFQEQLLRLAQLNQAKNIPTVFVLEANALEDVQKHLPNSHRIMREVAQTYGISLIDLHNCLAKDYDSGFLWWDFVHLTSYGQQLATQCLTTPLEEALTKTVKSNSSPVSPPS